MFLVIWSPKRGTDVTQPLNNTFENASRTIVRNKGVIIPNGVVSSGTLAKAIREWFELFKTQLSL